MVAFASMRGQVSSQSRFNQLVALPALEDLLSYSLYESSNLAITNVSKLPKTLSQLGLAHKRIFGFRSLEVSKHYQPLALICIAGDELSSENGMVSITSPALSVTLQPGETAKVLGLFLCLKMDFAAPTESKAIAEMTNMEIGAEYYGKVFGKFQSEIENWIIRHSGERPGVTSMEAVFNPIAVRILKKDPPSYPVDVEDIFRN